MAIRNLPYRAFALPTGIATNFSPETVAGKYLIQADNVDGFTEFRSIGKIPGSSKLNSSVTDPIKSIHFFEFFDYDRTFKRNLYVVTDDGLGNLRIRETVIATGVVDATGTLVDAAEPMFQAVMNSRLHLSSPNQGGTNVPNGGLKTDGTNFSNWGLAAPGSTVEVITNVELDDHTDWSINFGTPTLSTNTTNVIRGTGSVSIATTADALVRIERAPGAASIDLDPDNSGSWAVWFFVPPGALQNFNEGVGQKAVRIRYSTNDVAHPGVNQAYWDFTKAELANGWNLLSMAFADQTPSLSPNENSVSRVWIELDFAAADTRSGYLFNFGHSTDNGTPTPALGANSNSAAAIGSYRYRVTYVSEFGLESNAGPVSAPVVVTGVQATGSVTIGGGATTAGNTISVGQKTYTLVASISAPAVPNEILLGSGLTFLQRLADAINEEPTTKGIDYSTGTTQNVDVSAGTPGGSSVTLTARTAGSAGNSLVLGETDAQLSVTAFSGGFDGQEIDLTTIPTSPDAQCLSRRYYRDKDGDNIFRFVKEIFDNTDTTDTDAVGPQEDLSLVTPPIAGSVTIDHSPPEALADCTVHNSRVFGIRAEDRLTLLISNENEPEQFPILNQLQLEEEIIAVRSSARGLLVYTTDKVFILAGEGSDSNPFRLVLTNAELGANGPKTVARVKGFHIAVREKEAFFIDDPADPWFINNAVRDQWAANLTDAGLSQMFVVHDRSRFRLVFFGISSSGDFDEIWVWQYATLGYQEVSGDGPGVDPQDVRVGVWWKIVLPSGITPTCAVAAEDNSDTPVLWVGTDEGMIQRFQDPAVDTWARVSDTTAVISEWETSAIPIGADIGGRGEPRYLKINADGAESSNQVVTVTVLDDADGRILGTSQFTVTLGNNNTAPIVPIPNGGMMRGAWARVKVRSATQELKTIRSLTLYYVPRADFQGARPEA